MIELRLVKIDEDGNLLAATKPDFSPLLDGNRCPAMAMIDKAQGQALMDDLWRAGLRPTEGSGSAGAMARAEKQIEFMALAHLKQDATINRLLDLLSASGGAS